MHGFDHCLVDLCEPVAAMFEAAQIPIIRRPGTVVRTPDGYGRDLHYEQFHQLRFEPGCQWKRSEPCRDHAVCGLTG
jgi:hypothetical protein